MEGNDGAGRPRPHTQQSMHNNAMGLPPPRSASSMGNAPKTTSTRIIHGDLTMPVILNSTKQFVKPVNPYVEFYSRLATLRVEVNGNSAKNTAAHIEALENPNYRHTQCIDFFSQTLNPRISDALVAFLDGSKYRAQHRVQVLILDNNPKISWKGVIPVFKVLAVDKVLTTLHAERIGMGDEGALALAQVLQSNRTITHVNIAANNITPTGIQPITVALAHNDTLRFFGASYNKIRDLGGCAIASIMEYSKLTSLEVMGCRMGDPSIVAFGLSLSKNEILTHLRMTKNEGSHEAIDSLAELLQKNNTLLSATITGPENALAKVRAICKRNKRLKEDEDSKQLEKEVVRLHYQSTKLEMAKDTLEEYRKMAVDLEEAATKSEAKFQAEKADIHRKARDINNTIGFCETAKADLIKKREEYKLSVDKEKITAQETMDTLNDQLKNECIRTKRAEQHLAELQNTLQQQQASHEAKKDDIVSKIQGAKDERRRYDHERKEAIKKTKEIQETLESRQDELRVKMAELEEVQKVKKAAAEARAKKKKSKAMAAQEAEAAMAALLGD